MSDGLLTRAINNTGSAANSVLSLSDLPPSTASVLNVARCFSVEIEPGLSSIRTQIATTADTAIGSLNEALRLLEDLKGCAPDPAIDIVRRIVASTMENCSAAILAVERGIAANQAYFDSVTAQCRTIADTENDLDGQRVKLRSQIDAKQSEINAINSKLKYLGILGIFGLPGIAAAVALLEKARSELNGMVREIESLGTRLNAITQARGATNALAESTRTLTNTLLDLNNSFEFARADISDMLANLGQSGTASPILFITATLVEMRKLRDDAT